jgi:hypothetical protein
MPTKQRRRLLGIAVVALVLFAAHGLDHARHGELGAGSARLGVGSLGLMAAVFAAHLVVVLLVLRGHVFAPTVAANLGFGNVVGPLLFHHVVPNWRPVSGIFTPVHTDALSWAILAAIMAAGLLLGFAGLSAGRRSVDRPLDAVAAA